MHQSCIKSNMTKLILSIIYNLEMSSSLTLHHSTTCISSSNNLHQCHTTNNNKQCPKHPTTAPHLTLNNNINPQPLPIQTCIKLPHNKKQRQYTSNKTTFHSFTFFTAVKKRAHGQNRQNQNISQKEMAQLLFRAKYIFGQTLL